MNITKVAVLLVGVAMVTALTLPGRQTAQVLQAGGKVINGAIGTAIKG